MLRMATLVSVASLAIALTANAETKAYDLGSFSKLDVSAGVTVVFEESETQSITAENKNGNFDKLILTVKGDKLVVSRKSSGWFGGKAPDYTVTVSAPAVSAISASSGSRVDASGIVGSSVNVKVSSGANVDAANIEAGNISLAVSSGSNLDVYGTCGSASLSSSSGASLDADELVCGAVSASASSGASITGHATQIVNGSASSGASIKIIGGATDVEVSKSSGGSVKVS